MSRLLLVAFIGKVLETYSRGWTLGWIVITLVLILIERAMFRFAVAGGYERATSPRMSSSSEKRWADRKAAGITG